MKKLLIALVVGALLALPMSAMAMEKITSSDLDGVTGQAGVAVGFGNDVVTQISFSSLSWGDPDGVTGAEATGWLIIGSDSQQLTITSTIDQGGILELDVAYNQSAFTTSFPTTLGTAVTTTFVTATGTSYTTVITTTNPTTLTPKLFNGVAIPADKTFIALSLPSMSIGVDLPDTLQIGFGTASGMANMDCTLGLLNLEGLNVSQGSVSNLYIWCKD